MAEFKGGEEKLVRENESIVFENKTDSSFDVGMGVVFHKSGTYDVSIVGNKTTVSEVGKPKTWSGSDMTTHIISETLHECGIYGEEATITMISVLKRLGRSDLLLPCMR